MTEDDYIVAERLTLLRMATRLLFDAAGCLPKQEMLDIHEAVAIIGRQTEVDLKRLNLK